MGLMKVILPVAIVIMIVAVLVPAYFVYFANDLEQNVEVTGNNSDAWQVYTNGNHQIGSLLTIGGYVAGIIGVLGIIVFSCMWLISKF